MYEEIFQKLKKDFDSITHPGPNGPKKSPLMLMMSKFCNDTSGWFPYEQGLNECLTSKDWRMLNNFLYQCEKRYLLPCGSHGYDHCWCVMSAFICLSVGDIETFERILPREIQPSTNGYPFYVTAVNLLQSLWYKNLNTGFVQSSLEKARKFAQSKKPQWERSAISYMLALHRNDMEEAGNELEQVCKGFMKTSFSEDRKKLCLPAHGLYRLAFYLCEDKFQQLKMPDYKNFSKEYAAWKNKNNPSPGLYFIYPDEFDILNQMLLLPAAISEDIKSGRSYVQDVAHMFQKFADMLKDAGYTIE